MDRLFYGDTGGVTLTGGEVLAQPAFAAALLKRCRENHIHTAIETCGYAPWQSVEAVLKYVDLVLYDLKHMDSEQHKAGTGVGNELILNNLLRISADLDIPVIARMPVIPGYNDQASNLQAMGEFISKHVPTCYEVDLLPYHKLGNSKRESLEKGCDFQTDEPSADAMETLRRLLGNYVQNVK